MTDKTYRLIVEGELSDKLGYAFDGMALTRGEGTTTLTGDLRDQAELQSVLSRLSDLGLILLEVRAIDGRLEGRNGNEAMTADADRVPAPPSGRSSP